MGQTNINIRMDEDLKKQAEALFSDLGMNMSTAFNVFVKQSVRYGGIPFEVKIDKPNAETLAAIEEIRLMKKNPEMYKGYSDVDKMMEDILSK